jgi:hypothetical protein
MEKGNLARRTDLPTGRPPGEREFFLEEDCHAARERLVAYIDFRELLGLGDSALPSPVGPGAAQRSQQNQSRDLDHPGEPQL